jgi:hypothetical protein
MSHPIEQWEYTILLLAADPHAQQAFFEQYEVPPNQILPFDMRALIPQLNELGKDGWELVTLVPAEMGDNGDFLLTSGYNSQHWIATFLCTFKRRIG